MRTAASILTLSLATLILPGRLLGGDQDLTLRINDAIAEAGDEVVVVLRTYAPRGVGQGCASTSPNRRLIASASR